MCPKNLSAVYSPRRRLLVAHGKYLVEGLEAVAEVRMLGDTGTQGGHGGV